jgi:hypothetical protein
MLLLAPAWITVIFVGATAVFTGAALLVQYLGHRRERNLMGVKRKVHVIPHVRVQLQSVGVEELPNDHWEPENIRCFGFDLLNPAPYSMIATVHVEELRVGLHRRQALAWAMFDESSQQITLPPMEPQEVWVSVYSPNGWRSDTPYRAFVKFRIHSTAKEHAMTKRFWLQPLGWTGGS